MTTTTQKLIDRDIRARQEVRRATVLTEPRIIDFDTAARTSSLFVIDVSIRGATRPIRDVIVKSTSGKGGRAYAAQGKAVEIQRNAGGRWICIGPSDRISETSCVVLLDETDDSSVAAPDEGFSFSRRTYDFYENNNAYGIKGYGNDVITDAAGNEVP